MNDTFPNSSMIENDKIETEDKRVMVDIKMMDSKTLLDIKAFFF